MLPNQLTAGSFSAYPPEGRRKATSQLALLRRLPLAFVPLLLKELIVFDWKFPAERRELERQFEYLSSLSASEFVQATAGFAQLRLTADLERTDWVNSPGAFSEQLTSHLWASHQIDSFRVSAVEYMRQANAGVPTQPLPMHRLCIVVFGQGCGKSDYPLFRKLSPQGTLFRKVEHSRGMQPLLDAVAMRARKHPEPYGHWCIDGGAVAAVPQAPVAHVSYAGLSSARAALQSRMQRTYESSVFDPEAFRSMLARTRPEEIGMAPGDDPVLSRFKLSMLTEGSGTQVFATTFVQWTAREALRRAQPLTLFARFAPRQREKPMNELLAESQRTPDLDPEGSLIDADLGAYYTWLNQQRLTEPEKATFIAWFEDREQAMLIAPSIQRGIQNDAPVELTDLIARIA